MLFALQRILKNWLASKVTAARQIPKSKKPFVFSFQGIDCEVTLHRISNDSYGIGLKTDLPLNAKYMHSIQQYLEKEGFIDRLIEHAGSTRDPQL
jgi:hypothetical protein